jgi:glycerol-3-phosphate dehydrogenase
VDADSSLNSSTRSAAVARLRATSEKPLDVLIVGGGVVGCGVLLDAAVRGLDAVLVEQSDISSGTSSRSSRLAHGGLRYLEQFEFGLVHEPSPNVAFCWTGWLPTWCTRCRSCSP